MRASSLPSRREKNSIITIPETIYGPVTEVSVCQDDGGEIRASETRRYPEDQDSGGHLPRAPGPRVRAHLQALREFGGV